MADLGVAFIVAGPIVAGVVFTIGVGAAIQLRSRKNVVFVGLVAGAVDLFTGFRHRRKLTEQVVFAD